MVSKKLSTYLKAKFEPQIKDRDGENCFYCEKPFPTKSLGAIIKFKIDKNMTKEFDHLNNDRTDNRLENLVLAHRVCNRQKMKNPQWISKAKAKLRDNERSAEIPVAHADTDKETATETDTNSIYCAITLDYFAEKLQPKGKSLDYSLFIPYKETLDVIAGKAFKITGHASQSTVRRIVDMFCTNEFQYMKEKDEQRKYIIRLRREEEY